MLALRIARKSNRDASRQREEKTPSAQRAAIEAIEVATTKGPRLVR
jgi:hypothetical protein